VAILFYSGDKRNQTSTKQIPLNISRQEKEAYINSVEPKMEKAQVRLQEDLFVVRIKRLSEKTIQRHTQCVQEELKDEKKEENNNEEEGVVDVKKINQEFLDDIEISDDDEEGEKEKPNNNKPALLPSLLGIKKVMPQPAKKNEELSDYEALREKNMKDMRAMFLDEMKKQALGIIPKKTVVKHVIRRKYVPRPIKKIYGTRSRRNSSDEPLKSLDDKVDRTLLYEERRGRGDDTDEEEEYTPAKRRRHVHHHGHEPNEDIRTPESITEEDLANVATCVSDKVYSQSGTTCHQCRQKTTDQKTICRSGRCHGVRGFFCGVCLKNRYGEDAREALKDPDWWCPPCLDVCNCSICRNRYGKGATGPLTWLAQEKGFPSVRHYLESLVQRRGTDRFDE